MKMCLEKDTLPQATWGKAIEAYLTTVALKLSTIRLRGIGG